MIKVSQGHYRYKGYDIYWTADFTKPCVFDVKYYTRSRGILLRADTLGGMKYLINGSK